MATTWTGDDPSLCSNCFDKAAELSRLKADLAAATAAKDAAEKRSDHWRDATEFFVKLLEIDAFVEKEKGRLGPHTVNEWACIILGRLKNDAESAEAALADERRKFQQETRRTSELVTMLRRASDFIVTSDGAPGAFNRGAFVKEIDALLAKPINHGYRHGSGKR